MSKVKTNMEGMNNNNRKAPPKEIKESHRGKLSRMEHSHNTQRPEDRVLAKKYP